MREIKFRALKDDMSDCRFIYGYLIYLSGVPKIQGVGKNTKLFTTCIKETEGQYTGLKDKNGKEIYEGDILKYTQHSMYLMETQNIDIVFNSEQSAFGYNTNMGFVPFNAHDELVEDVLDYCEVIGNIYENKDLIK